MKPYDIRQPAMPFTPLSSEKRVLSSHTGRPPDVAGYTPPVATDSHPQLHSRSLIQKFKPSKKKLQVPSTNPLLPLKHAILISFSTFQVLIPKMYILSPFESDSKTSYSMYIIIFVPPQVDL